VSSGFDVVKKMFDTIDEDHSGEITHQEFSQAFLDICRDPEIVEARMKELDYNKDEEITFREFIFGIASWVGFNDVEDDNNNNDNDEDENNENNDSSTLNSPNYRSDDNVNVNNQNDTNNNDNNDSNIKDKKTN